MDHYGELGRLEEMVERLLAQCNEVRCENKRLEERLLSRESELAALDAEVESLKREKEQVLRRISGLLALMEKWEGEADAEAVAQAGSAGALDSGLAGGAS